MKGVVQSASVRVTCISTLAIADNHVFCRCHFDQMISLLIFSHWDLHKPSQELLAYPFPNHAQVLFHSFLFGLLISVDVSNDDFQVTMYDY